jgi:hypothetical protein
MDRRVKYLLIVIGIAVGIFLIFYIDATLLPYFIFVPFCLCSPGNRARRENERAQQERARLQGEPGGFESETETPVEEEAPEDSVVPMKDGARICTNCGSLVEQDNLRFCPYCGKKM